MQHYCSSSVALGVSGLSMLSGFLFTYWGLVKMGFQICTGGMRYSFHFLYARELICKRRSTHPIPLVPICRLICHTPRTTIKIGFNARGMMSHLIPLIGVIVLCSPCYVHVCWFLVSFWPRIAHPHPWKISA